MTNDAPAVEVSPEDQAKPFEPIAVSPALAAMLPQLFGDAHYKLSEDGTQIVEWNHPGDPPTEEDCAAALTKAKVTFARAARGEMMQKSDVVAWRCFKAGMPFPADWLAFTVALREWPQNPDRAAPIVPALPKGV